VGILRRFGDRLTSAPDFGADFLVEEPRYKSLVVALAPQPRQMPPPPFDQDALHAAYREIIADYRYQSFEFIFDGRGALLHNGEEDLVELRPALLRIQAKMDGPDLLTGPMAAKKANRILEIASEQLGPDAFVQCGIQIVGAVDAPDGDARKFVEEKLLRDAVQAEVLGDGYFGGGVRFRAIRPDQGGEDSLSIEPFIQDNSLVHLDHQMGRTAIATPFTLEQVSGWTDDAFAFLAGPTVELLSS
jgi:hypothetical protein